MQNKIVTKTKKTITLPARMFRMTDLEKMEVEYVPRKIFLNIAKPTEGFPDVPRAVHQHMAVLNYPDCSRTPFSLERLQRACSAELEKPGDLIIIPAFKGEGQGDIELKLRLVQLLKGITERDIVFEISYKNAESMDAIINAQANIDYLAVYLGASYGRFPSTSQLLTAALRFKQATGKPVFVTAVPLMFASEGTTGNPTLVPFWDLVVDGWAKDWHSSGGSEDIKVIDFADRVNRDEFGWLGKHRPDEMVPYIDTSVHSLFDNTSSMKERREQYKRMLIDEALTEAASVMPTTVEQYVLNRVPSIYQVLVLSGYREKMLIQLVRHGSWLEGYIAADRILLENSFRDLFSPSLLMQAIEQVKAISGVQRTAQTLLDRLEIFKNNGR